MEKHIMVRNGEKWKMSFKNILLDEPLLSQWLGVSPWSGRNPSPVYDYLYFAMCGK